MPLSSTGKEIPTQLTLTHFNEFVLPYLKMGSSKPVRESCNTEPSEDV